MELIKRQRVRFTVTTTLIMAVFLFILLGAFFAVTWVSNDMYIARSLKTALGSPKTYNDFAQQSLKCVFILVEDNGKYSFVGDPSKYEQLADELVSKAMAGDSQKFRIGDSYFMSARAQYDNGNCLLAIIDRTPYRTQIVNTALQITVLYCCAVALIAVIAFLASARLLHPVSEAFSKQRDLIANASHELKTPLTIISTDISVIKSEPLSTVDDNAHWIESIDAQIGRMQGLIQNMLELSRLEQSALPMEELCLSDIAEGACLTFEPVCFEKHVQLQSDIQPGISMTGDKNSLERLFVILLDNAIKYCGNGKVGLELNKDKKNIRVLVLNTGECITKEEAEHVFDRFYRTDGARKNDDNQSFGLGLSIAQATVKAHMGSISCRGIEGKGTVFEVTFPLKQKSRKKRDK